jgi:hypothetical protein
MQTDNRETRKIYQAPEITEWGTMVQLTQSAGNNPPGDGSFPASVSNG